MANKDEYVLGKLFKLIFQHGYVPEGFRQSYIVPVPKVNFGKLLFRQPWTNFDTIRYDSVYLTCSKKLTGSQLSLPHGINKKIKM